MDEIANKLAQAARLDAITKQVGFALWQLQELEGVAARYFVLVTQARKGMGMPAGEVLVEKAQRKTFGGTVHEIAEAGLLTADLKSRFTKLLAERKWLVHQSRATSRNAVYHDRAMDKLVLRLDAIADESRALLRELGVLAERYVKAHGVTPEFIEKAADELLRQWQAADAI